jgi:hypothetical protein
MGKWIRKSVSGTAHMYIALRTVGTAPGKAENRASQVKPAPDSLLQTPPPQPATSLWRKTIYP